MESREGRQRWRACSQALGSEMDFSRSSPTEDESAMSLARGGRVEAGECKWQGEGAGEGLWPQIHEVVGPWWTRSMGSCEEGQGVAIG